VSNEEALDVLARALARCGYDDGRMMMSLDVAASEFGKGGRYRLALEGRTFDRSEWLKQLQTWRRRYPIVSLEDPFGEDDPEGFREVTALMGEDVQIIGDDFLVTSVTRVKEAQDSQACNAVLIKPNQVGTLTEAKAALEAAKAKDWGTVISARSGETEDVTIAHLAVGWAAGQLKVGSFTRSERMAKCNEVIRIEEELGARAEFVGPRALPVHRSSV